MGGAGEPVVVVEWQAQLAPAIAPFDPGHADRVVVVAFLGRGERLVERLERLRLVTGIRACVAQRDEQLRIVTELAAQRLELGLASVPLTVLQQVPPEHLAAEDRQLASELDRAALSARRQPEVALLGGDLREVVVEVSHPRLASVLRQLDRAEYPFGLLEGRRFAIRLEQFVYGDGGHVCTVARTAAASRLAARRVEVWTRVFGIGPERLAAWMDLASFRASCATWRRLTGGGRGYASRDRVPDQ